MKIFNETLKFNPIKYKSSKKPDLVSHIIISYLIITILLHIILKNNALTLSLIVSSPFVLLGAIVYNELLIEDIKRNNPLSKLLYPINEQAYLDLINLWNTYNITYRKTKPIIISSISFNYEIINKINNLFEKLDYGLMNILEKQDINTLKILNLEDIDSYKKLYMLIIAPQEVKDIKYEIQKLHKKLLDSKSFYLLENLTQMEQEVDKKCLDENCCYFEYKKWHKTIKETLENINNEKYIDEKTKQNYNQIIKDINQ